MPTFQPYHPEQAELLPAHVRDVLGADHLCFLLHEVVESWEVQEFVDAYSEAGGQSPYDPRLMLKVWLYAFALNVRTTRKLEQRVREDLGFRFLAGGAAPDHKTLSEFHRRHAVAIRRLFTQMLGLLRKAGLAQVGTVAIDSTRIGANASRERVLREADLERKVAEWQKHLDDDPDRAPGTRVGREQPERVREQLQRVRESGETRLSQSDPEARFLRQAGGGFTLGYTAELAVSADHFIVAERVTQAKADNQALVPMVDEVERQCRERPARVLADSGFFSRHNLEEMQKQGVDAYIPDSNLSQEIKSGRSADVQKPTCDPLIAAMRHKLRTPEGKQRYRQRQGLVEPVFGILKEHRGLRKFQRRGLAKVAVEQTLAALAFNITRWHRLRRAVH
jgi:transposase